MIVILEWRVDLRCCQVVFNIYLLSLNAIDLTEWQVKANKYLLDYELSKHQLVEVGHQVWKIAQVRYRNLKRYGTPVEVQELDDKGVLRLADPWSLSMLVVLLYHVEEVLLSSLLHEIVLHGRIMIMHSSNLLSQFLL